MRSLWKMGLALGAFLAAATPACAEIGGTWRINGTVQNRNFVMDCQFNPQGAQFGGQCTSLSTGEAKVKPGKVSPLTRGSINGDKVQFAYKARVMFWSLDVVYDGTLAGDRLNGTVNIANGRIKGTFAGVRK